MSELRWNPLLGTWTIVAAKRQNRPNLSQNYCPFCPGDGKNVPSDYEVLAYPNDFPALSEGVKGDLLISEDGIFKKAEAKGTCEVILYSSQHEQLLYELSDTHILKIVNLWAERLEFYRKNPIVQYVYEFENRGHDVGVTIAHPHGQLYAFPYVPAKIEMELERCQSFYEESGQNLFQELIQQEIQAKVRVIFETKYFLVFLPYFTDFPYGIFIVSKTPVLWVSEMNDEQRLDLARVLKDVSGMFDCLYDRVFPYMMCIHQGVLNNNKWVQQADFYRFHIEFYPPWRAPEVVKYYASAETGAWAATNTRLVEETAIELKEALFKFKRNKHG